MEIKSKIFFLLVLVYSASFSQNTILEGAVNAEEGVESVHVINQTQKRYSITNDKGFFKIEAKKNDSIVFTSVQYTTLTHVVTLDNINNKKMSVNLEVQVNELPEAFIGFTLTGDLTKDVLSSNAKRTIDFYDVGIPGYKGKLKTKSQRLLSEATSGGGLIPLNPILNEISGRTKELKKRVKLEANTKMMNALKNRLSEAFFKENELIEDLRAEFFYFCAEDATFKQRCEISDLEALKFMKEKYIRYKENLAEKNN
ncbi:MAG: hypothetical protein QNK89_11450 [Lacinutrix sp.]|uniref:hypothetical protein n=1 Tax=Lacinutrix sp. TaxID=1937692 RepID=UPI00309C971C